MGKVKECRAQVEDAMREAMRRVISYYGETEEDACYDIDVMTTEAMKVVDEFGLASND